MCPLLILFSLKMFRLVLFHLHLYNSCLTINIMQLVTISFLVSPNRTEPFHRCTSEFMILFNHTETSSHIFWAFGQSNNRCEMVSIDHTCSMMTYSQLWKTQRDSLWGQMGPNFQVESICGHIFVRHFHILIIFDHMIANGDTKKSINPNDLDWPWMTLKWHKKTFFLSISLFQSHFLPKFVWK